MRGAKPPSGDDGMAQTFGGPESGGVVDDPSSPELVPPELDPLLPLLPPLPLALSVVPESGVLLTVVVVHAPAAQPAVKRTATAIGIFRTAIVVFIDLLP